MELVFATNNQHKLKEIKNALGNSFELKSLADLNFKEDIPETHETLEENAMEKAEHIYSRFNVNCFADDTGLEIEALNGEPGVYSARYAGENPTFDDNMNKVLLKLSSETRRSARFRTVIALILDGEKYYFEGEVNGEILVSKSGRDGFGYDPIFKPEGCNQSFAEMSLDLKNKISHRGKAVKKLVKFLKTL
jgi:XTP/dITP diphosphohydrolase